MTPLVLTAGSGSEWLIQTRQSGSGESQATGLVFPLEEEVGSQLVAHCVSLVILVSCVEIEDRSSGRTEDVFGREEYGSVAGVGVEDLVQD